MLAVAVVVLPQDGLVDLVADFADVADVDGLAVAVVLAEHTHDGEEKVVVALSF